MLTYRINKNNISKKDVSIPIEGFEIVDFANIFDDLKDEDGEKLIVNDTSLTDKMMIVCYCKTIDDITVGSKIRCSTSMTCNYSATMQDNYWSDGIETYTYTENLQNYSFNREYSVCGINEGELSFSFMVPKYYTFQDVTITRNDIKSVVDGTIETSYYLSVNGEPHYFGTENNGKAKMYIKYMGGDGKENKVNLDCTFIDPYTLFIDNESLDDGILTIIGLSDGTNNPPFDEGANFLSREANLGGVEIYRDNFIFDDNTRTNFVFEKTLVKIDLPISHSFETNLFQNELLNEHFVNAEKEKAINKIIDVEKDVYYPAIYTYGEDENYKFEKDVYTIKFNLHFREHRGDNWLVEDSSFWNGVKTIETKTDDDNVKKEGEMIETITDSNVSDLLTFLNFTNNDVYYQKSKLTKSFLRLSFYDSNNPSNQNLVAYSTIFYNTGDMFSRYIKYMETDGYTQILSNTYGEYETNINKVGIKVDREHNFDEELRLSSQFVVKSKNTSDSSSDGFYLYVWKDNESALPQDLYMKVEFNHAGYGRTVPFMLPFNDRKKHGSGSIKSFKDILDDFNGERDCTEGQTVDGPYGMQQYIKYSHIHLKYQYDNDKQRHYYYLDPLEYGAISGDNNELVINLYEAKISMT